MGCSDKSVSGRGAGAGLLREPRKIAQIFDKLTRALDIPITGKIRLGWDDDSRNYLEVARIIEDNGGSLIAVHGRTKAQGYTGEADWDAIAQVKQAVSIPVIANGDVKSVADIQRVKAHTGCDGVMIARAAIGNPWIFSRIDRQEVSPDVVRDTILEHLTSNLHFYGAEKGLIFFRKYAVKILISAGLAGELRQRMLTTTQVDEFVDLLDNLLTVPA